MAFTLAEKPHEWSPFHERPCTLDDLSADPLSSPGASGDCLAGDAAAAAGPGPLLAAVASLLCVVVLLWASSGAVKRVRRWLPLRARSRWAGLGAYVDEYAVEEEEAALRATEPRQPEACHAQAALDDGGDLCAICLNAIELEDLAIIKSPPARAAAAVADPQGCEHAYCVNCILQWAACKEAAWCPQCKHPFNYLYCHRQLDGTLSDAPVEESVCLLKRATWFVEHVKTLEKGKAVSGAMAAADDEVQPEWADPYYFQDEEDDGYDDEEEIEKYYFSSAAGAARVVLGNRRMGENGFMRSGRLYARPAPNSNAAASNAGGGGSGNIGKAGKGRAGGGSKAADAAAASAGAGGSGAGGSGGSGAGGSGAGGSGAGPSGPRAAAPAAGASQAARAPGRRAKRNARRAVVDYDDDDY
ncbi:hypothetical protein TSOC_008946 [Tetrabaena socialis]|uniref:RING-type domain-containing protein n=1 Tax=Tetrabaena socialis TaxID=47790 RepID=A0A2J7ZX58_9CHLO|nr:hypothetical protein TSOC_008946 [Tetrabaena socialis]|eukprot:PNH04861.1 hypothetical protein TSOC_008946 [Tetrabaena socialis]